MTKLFRRPFVYVTVLATLVAAGSSLSFANTIKSTDKESLAPGRTGAIIPSPEELDALHKRKVKKVKPNALGLERANKERARRGKSPLSIIPAKTTQEEMEIEMAGAIEDGTSSAASASSLPAQVDNSSLAAFPPIADQGGENSCVGFAVGYYQASHENCLVKGCSNQSASTYTASPRWVYNLLNDGNDLGSSWTRAFDLLEKNGYTNLKEQPYSEGDYKKWNTNASQWQAALSRKVESVQSIRGLNTPEGLAAAKQILANGHVLTFATYINSWKYAYIGKDPNDSNSFVGEKIATYSDGKSGLHMMTVVGFDDSIWVDINQNGDVDSGEKGAFKIANSWGTRWGQNGYMWVAYDAANIASSVVDGPSPTTRSPIFRSYTLYSMNAHLDYKPSLVAKFTLKTAARGKMWISAASTLVDGSPISYRSGALYGQGGDLAFDGSSISRDGSFALDISSLINGSNDLQNFTLSVSASNAVGEVTPTEIKDFELVDVTNSRTIAYIDTSLPDYVQSSTKKYTIAYNASSEVSEEPPVVDEPVVDEPVVDEPSNDTPELLAPENLIASVSSQQKGKGKKARVSSRVELSWSSSALSIASYQVLRNGVVIANTSQSSYTDTSVSSGERYTYSVVAVDAAGNLSPASNSVTVSP